MNCLHPIKHRMLDTYPVEREGYKLRFWYLSVSSPLRILRDILI